MTTTAKVVSISNRNGGDDPDPEPLSGALDRRGVPAATVVRFPKRTVFISVRVPPELDAAIQCRADALYLSRATYILRVLWEVHQGIQGDHCDREEKEAAA
jgi:hypothetical protein